MKMWCLFLLAFQSVAMQVDESDASTDAANPLAKIITMMEDMKAELEKEAKDEKELFEEAMCICKKGEKELGGVITFSTAEIERLESAVESGTATKAKLGSELKDHATDKEETTKALEEATVIREKENAKFKETEADMKSNLDGLSQAIPLIEQQPAGASFLQGVGGSDHAAKLLRIVQDEAQRYLSADKRETITSFLENSVSGGEEQPELSAGVAEILGILKSMKDEMSADLDEISKDEHTAAVGYQEMKETKSKHLTLLSETILDKEKREGEATLALAEDKDSLDDTNEELANAQKYLAQLQKACETKASQRDVRAKMRMDEITALSEAITILSDDDATAAIKKATGNEPALLTMKRQKPQRGYWALVQKTATLKEKTDAHKRKRPLLKLLSVKTATHEQSEDLFTMTRPAGIDKDGSAAVKVVNFMIDNMVHQLHNDDIDDEHKKDWCFNETDVMTRVQEEKTVLEDTLNTSIAEMTEQFNSLTTEIKELEDTIYQQDQTVLKATAQRKEEHDEFVKTYAATDTALRLLDRAATKLNRIYNPEMQKAKEEAVKQKALEEAGLGLLQKSSKAAVQLHSSKKASDKVDPIVLPDTPVEYEKKESGGLIGLMDKLKSELKADSKEAEVDEKYATRDYVALMKDQKVMRAQNVKSLHTKQAQGAELDEKIQQDTQMQEFTIQELAALKVYLRQLDIECTFIMKNYEARHDVRVGEEMGLEGAETIVTKEEPPTHEGTEKKYEEEHSQAEVEEHFPHDTLKDAMR